MPPKTQACLRRRKMAAKKEACRKQKKHLKWPPSPGPVSGWAKMQENGCRQEQQQHRRPSKMAAATPRPPNHPPARPQPKPPKLCHPCHPQKPQRPPTRTPEAPKTRERVCVWGGKRPANGPSEKRQERATIQPPEHRPKGRGGGGGTSHKIAPPDCSATHAAPRLQTLPHKGACCGRSCRRAGGKPEESAPTHSPNTAWQCRRGPAPLHPTPSTTTQASRRGAHRPDVPHSPTHRPMPTPAA